MIHVILIDDHGLIRQGLQTLLDATGDIKVIAATDSLAAAEAYLNRAHVVICHFRHMAQPASSEFSQWQHLAPQAAWIVMAGAEQQALIPQMFGKGLLGFVDSHTTAEEFIGAVRKVAKGLRYLPPQVAQQLALQAMGQSQGSLSDNPFDRLTAQEMACALLLIQAKDSAEISQALEVEVKSVNAYRHRIFRKLAVSGDVELIKLAIRYGLLAD